MNTNIDHLSANTMLNGGRYRIDAFLASGGFGNTYRATRTDFNETVAIKEFFMKEVSQRDTDSRSVTVTHPDGKEKFEEQKNKFFIEAERMRTLRHPHIIEVIDRFKENNTAYYVMEYIHGGTLAEYVGKHGAVSEEMAKKYLLHILDALQTVHENGIYHLDIKPSNIMIDERRDRAILIDFGASKQMSAETGITLGSALCYTPGYAPSEQVEQAHDKFGPWTDLYALGGTLYFATTGEKPPLPSAINEEGERAFHFPSGMSQEMRHLILWMMSPMRPSRPQTVNEIQKLLQTPQAIVSKTSTSISSHQDVSSDETLISSGGQQNTGHNSTVVQQTQPPLQPRSSSTVAKKLENGDDRKPSSRSHWYIALGVIAVFLFIIIIAGSQGDGMTEASIWEEQSDTIDSVPGTIEEPEPDYDDLSDWTGCELSGWIGEYNVDMVLERESGSDEVTGSYEYLKSGGTLNLSGSLYNNLLELDETNQYGEETGHFKGELSERGFRYRGEFTNYKGESFRFDLAVQ